MFRHIPIKCRIECKHLVSNRMQERMPDRMSEHMSDRMAEKKPVIMANVYQIENQNLNARDNVRIYAR